MRVQEPQHWQPDTMQSTLYNTHGQDVYTHGLAQLRGDTAMPEIDDLFNEPSVDDNFWSASILPPTMSFDRHAPNDLNHAALGNTTEGLNEHVGGPGDHM